MKKLCCYMMKRLHCLLLLIVFGITQQIHAQTTHTVTGVVKSATGEPLTGATVSVKNSKLNTLTDEQGRYTLQLRDAKATILFSHTGFTTQQHDVMAPATL